MLHANTTLACYYGMRLLMKEDMNEHDTYEWQERVESVMNMPSTYL